MHKKAKLIYFFFVPKEEENITKTKNIPLSAPNKTFITPHTISKWTMDWTQMEKRRISTIPFTLCTLSHYQFSSANGQFIFNFLCESKSKGFFTCLFLENYTYLAVPQLIQLVYRISCSISCTRETFIVFVLLFLVIRYLRPEHAKMVTTHVSFNWRKLIVGVKGNMMIIDRWQRHRHRSNMKL